MSPAPTTVLLALLLAAGAAARDARQMPDPQQLRRSGWRIVAEKFWDIDGDGRLEYVLVVRRGEMLQLNLWQAREVSEEEWLRHNGPHRKDRPGVPGRPRPGQGAGRNPSPGSRPGPYYLFTGVAALPPRRADELVRLEVVSLGQGRRALWYQVAEQNPDEDDNWVQLVLVQGTGARVILDTGYRRVHSESEAGRPARWVIGSLPEPPGIELVADPAGQWPLAVVRHPSEWLRLQGTRGGAWLAAGRWTERYRYRQGRYQPAGRVFAEALERLGGPVRQPGPLRLAVPRQLRLLRGQAGQQDCRVPARWRLRLDGKRWLDIDTLRPQDLPAPVAATGSFRRSDGAPVAVLLVAFDPPPAVRHIEIRDNAQADRAAGSPCTWSWEAFADGPPGGGRP